MSSFSLFSNSITKKSGRIQSVNINNNIYGNPTDNVNNQQSKPNNVQVFDDKIFFCWIKLKDKFNDKEYGFHLFLKHNATTHRYPFRAKIKQIKSAYYKYKQYFAKSKFPTVSKETMQKITKLQKKLKRKRIKLAKDLKMHDPIKEQLKEEKTKLEHNRLKKMEKYMLFNQNCDTECMLITLFNSPILIKKGYLFKIFQNQFDENIQELLKKSARNWLNKLRNISRNSLTKNKKHSQICSNIQLHNLLFYRVFVVKKRNSAHWILKFEGFNKLLSIDFLGNSYIYIQLLDNDCLGQRIFWYGQTYDINNLYFIDRLQPLCRLNIFQCIYGRKICHLIGSWLEYNEYNAMSNNCQHFVRDIVSIIDINTANKLTKSLSRILIANIIAPSFQKTNIKEYQRTINIRKKLKDSLKEPCWYRILTMCDLIEFYSNLKNESLSELKKMSKDQLLNKRFPDLGITKIGHKIQLLKALNINNKRHQRIKDTVFGYLKSNCNHKNIPKEVQFIILVYVIGNNTRRELGYV